MEGLDVIGTVILMKNLEQYRVPLQNYVDDVIELGCEPNENAANVLYLLDLFYDRALVCVNGLLQRVPERLYSAPIEELIELHDKLPQNR